MFGLIICIMIAMCLLINAWDDDDPAIKCIKEFKGGVKMDWNTYPYTDFHELNLDFILEKIGDIESTINIPVDIYPIDDSVTIDGKITSIILGKLCVLNLNFNVSSGHIGYAFNNLPKPLNAMYFNVCTIDGTPIKIKIDEDGNLDLLGNTGTSLIGTINYIKE